MTESTYSSREVCEIAEISYRQLDYWDRIGFLSPSVAEARGSGSSRRYSVRDVDLAYATRVLLDAGVSLQAIREARDRETLAEFVAQLGEAGARLRRWYEAEAELSGALASA